MLSGAVSGSPNATSGSGSSKSQGSGGNKGGSRAPNIGAIVGGVVGGVVGLLVLVGAAFWFLRRRKTQEPASVPDLSGAMMEPTPFVQSEPVVFPLPQADHVPEKRRREMQQRENVPLLPSTAPSTSVLSSEGSSGRPGASTISSDSYRSRQDELVGLRTEIADLRRIMLSAQVEGSEAPPEYY